MWEKCREWRKGEGSWQEVVKWMLGEDGNGENVMRDIEEARSKVEGRRSNKNGKEG